VAFPDRSNGPSHPPPAADIDLRRYLRAGDTVMWGQASAEPLTLTRALAEQQPAIGALRCFVGVSLGANALHNAPDVRFVSYGGGGLNRVLDSGGRLDILPSHYSELPRLIESGAVRVDVLLVQVTPSA
jgi:hypothetical protein